MRLQAVGVSPGWKRVVRAVGPRLGVLSWAWRHRAGRTMGLGGPRVSPVIGVRSFQLQETGDPLLLHNLKTGQVELRGLGP